MQYKGVHRPLREIARELGVDGVVEGSIARSGDRVHMTLQLIQGESDTHVWANSYDRDAKDLVSLPDEAAVAIAKKLKSSTVSAVPARTVLPEAHDAYLHGRYLWYAGVNDEAGKYFRKATELQPDYALAWVGMSMYYIGGAHTGELNPEESLGPGEEAAEKAVELDDSLPESHLVMCAAIYTVKWDWTRADTECLRAIELDPKFAEVHHFRSKILSALNQHDASIEEQKKATELDPFARPWALAYSYLLARRFDLAIEDIRQRLESYPHDVISLWILATAYRAKGQFQDKLSKNPCIFPVSREFGRRAVRSRLYPPPASCKLFKIYNLLIR